MLFEPPTETSPALRAGARVGTFFLITEKVYYIFLRMEFNSSKDLIVVQSGSGKIPIGS